MLVGIQAVVAHANTVIRSGSWITSIVLPRYHHWHHARHIDYWDRNYAIHLPVIDMLMGPFKLPRGRQLARGVRRAQARDCAERGIVAQHLAPFRGDRTYDDDVA